MDKSRVSRNCILPVIFEIVAILVDEVFEDVTDRMRNACCSDAFCPESSSDRIVTGNDKTLKNYFKASLILEKASLRLEKASLRLEKASLRLKEASLRLEMASLRLKEANLRLVRASFGLTNLSSDAVITPFFKAVSRPSRKSLNSKLWPSKSSQ